MQENLLDRYGGPIRNREGNEGLFNKHRRLHTLARVVDVNIVEDGPVFLAIRLSSLH